MAEPKYEFGSSEWLGLLKATFPVPNGLPDVQAMVELVPSFVAAYRSALHRREQLAVPPDDRARFREHYGAYAEALDDLDEFASRTPPGTDAETFVAALRPVSEEFYPLNDFEVAYGFKRCGSEDDQFSAND